MEKEERERKGCIVLLHDKRFRIVATNVPTNSAPLSPRSGRGEEEEEVPEGEVDRWISREREREGRREREGGEMRIERKGRKEEGRGGGRERDRVQEIKEVDDNAAVVRPLAQGAQGGHYIVLLFRAYAAISA